MPHLNEFHLPWPFMIWYCLFSSAELLLIFRLLREPSLERLLLRLKLSSTLLETAPDSMFIVLYGSEAVLFWFCRGLR